MHKISIFISSIFLAVILIITLSCNDKLSKERYRAISNLVGKELIIPDDLQFKVMNKHVSFDLGKEDFKIITYVDSTGCTSCNMNLPL